VGGERALYDRYRPLLEAMGDQPYYVGPVGAGAVAKLVHNCASFTIRAVLAEVFSMGVKAGVAPDLLWQAVRQGNSGRRRTFDVLAEKFLPGEFEPPSFALRLGHKDVSLATALGREYGVPMRLANLALEEITEALGRGWGDRDSSSFMLLEEERAGVVIKVPRERLQQILEQDGR
jgi:3-hydroxyisobutyrate dehydrogenase